MTTHKTPKDEVLLALHGAREAIAGMAAARLDDEPSRGNAGTVFRFYAPGPRNTSLPSTTKGGLS